jgi:hypothetical protein
MKNVDSYAAAFAAALLGLSVGRWQANQNAQEWRLRLGATESRLEKSENDRAAEGVRRESELAALRSELAEARERLSRQAAESGKLAMSQGPHKQPLSFRATDPLRQSSELRELPGETETGGPRIGVRSAF